MSDIEPKSKAYTIIWPNGSEELATITRPDLLQKPKNFPSKIQGSSLLKFRETTQEQFEIMTEAYLRLTKLYSEKVIEDKLLQYIYKWGTRFSKSAKFIVETFYNFLAKGHPLIYTDNFYQSMTDIIEQVNYCTQNIQALRMDCVLNGKFPNTTEFSNFFETDSMRFSEILNAYHKIRELTPGLKINIVNRVKFA